MNIKHYNNNVQLDKAIIKDIFSYFKNNPKFLMFGCGHDTKMWAAGNENTYFVEDNMQYINLAKQSVPEENLIQVNYETTVDSSERMTDEEIANHPIPDKIIKEAPFDIVLVDGPMGWGGGPGRLMPCYWAKMFTKEGSIVYVDDSERSLESYAISKFFKDKNIIVNKDKDCNKTANHIAECTKIFI